MSWNSIVLNIVLSIIASFCFWLLTFKISFTKVIFANSLAKPDNTLTDVKKVYGYRVRFANVGYRDLMEITMVVKMVIAEGVRDHIFFLDISNSGKQNFITFLPGMITNKIKRRSNMRTLTIYPSETMQHELSKSKYPENIRRLAENGEVQFKDIFDEYGENVTIRIYIYGNDRITGARRMFESQPYNIYNIEEGDFLGAKKINLSFFSRTKVKRDKISKINKKVCV